MSPLLLLHGAIGSRAQFEPLQQTLSASLDVHYIDLPGHGSEPVPGDFSIEGFADFVKDYCVQHRWSKVDIFGYSMGGYVALHLAAKEPLLVNRVATLATKFHWDEATAAKEVRNLQPEIIEAKLPQFAATLKERHRALDWKDLLQKTASLLESLGKHPVLTPTQYAALQQRVLLMLGDRDKMVGLEETVAVYRALPQASLAVLPQTPHPIETVDSALLSFHLHRFFSRN